MASNKATGAKRKNSEQRPGKRSKAEQAAERKLACRVTAPKNAPVIGFGDDEPLLPRMLHPVTVEEFKATYFHRHPLHIRAASVARIAPVLDTFLGGDVEAIVENTASERVHIWCKDQRNGKLQSIALENPAAAVHLHAAGHSVYCRAPEDVEGVVVRKLLAELGLGIRPTSSDRFTRGEIEMFCSKKGHITGFHTDFQENFTIQLTGRKRWYIRPSTVEHPLRGCTPHYDSPEVAEQQLKVHHLVDGNFSFEQCDESSCAAEEQVFEVGPGDVLYHPAGCWHRVECLEDSVSMNVSMIASSYADIVSSGLTQLLWSDADWRRQVNTGSREEAVAHLGRLLDKLKAQLARCDAEWFLPPMICNSEQLDVGGGCGDEGCADGECGHSCHDGDCAHDHHDHDHGHDHDHKHDGDGDEDNDEEDESHDHEEHSEEGSSDADEAEDHVLHIGDVQIDDKDVQVFSDASTALYFNPIATLIRGTALAVAGWDAPADEDHSLYVCHVGYGNESLDSISSSTIAIPSVLDAVMDAVIEKSQQAKTATANVSKRVGELLPSKLLKSEPELATQLLKVLEFVGVVYRR